MTDEIEVVLVEAQEDENIVIVLEEQEEVVLSDVFIPGPPGPSASTGTYVEMDFNSSATEFLIKKFTKDIIINRCLVKIIQPFFDDNAAIIECGTSTARDLLFANDDVHLQSTNFFEFTHVVDVPAGTEIKLFVETLGIYGAGKIYIFYNEKE